MVAKKGHAINLLQETPWDPLKEYLDTDITGSEWKLTWTKYMIVRCRLTMTESYKPEAHLLDNWKSWFN